MLKGERSNNGISSNLANTPNRRKLRMKGTNFFENKVRFLNEATGISFWARATSFKDAKAIEKKLNNLKGDDFKLACERIRISPTQVVLDNTLMQQSVIPTTSSTLDYQHVDSCDLGDVGKSDDVAQSPLETKKELKSMDRVLQNLTMGSLASESPKDIGKSDDVTQSPLEIAEELKSLDIVPQNLTIGNIPSECPDIGKRDDVTQSPLETAKELKSLDIVPQNLTIVNLPSECPGDVGKGDDVTQSPLETAKELKSLDTTPQNLPIGNLPSECPGIELGFKLSNLEMVFTCSREKFVYKHWRYQNGIWYMDANFEVQEKFKTLRGLGFKEDKFAYMIFKFPLLISVSNC